MSIPTTEENADAGVSSPVDAAATAAPETGAAPNEESLLSQLQIDLERFRDLALRTQADFENFRKRAIRDKDDAIRYANASMLERLIPILDNFELGLSAARSGTENSPILMGMEMVSKQLTDFLIQNGVEPIVAEGAKFDPNLHEAVAQEVSDSIPEGYVVRQLRRGFKLKDRLLRPSTVIISKGAE